VPSLQFHLFGQLRVSRGDESVTAVNTNRLRSLLAYLLLHSEASQSREYVAFLLWPDSEESQARTNLRQLLHHLRRAVPEPERILTDGATIQWKADSDCRVDVAEFLGALARAGDAQRQNDARAERKALSEAAALYEDDLLPELYDDWVKSKRDELRQRCNQALSRLATLLEESSDYAGAIACAERLLAHDALQETTYQQLIRLYALADDRAAAVRTYNQCQKVLRRELGISPGPATRRLFDRLLKSEERAALPLEAPPPSQGTSVPLIARNEEWGRLLECWQLCRHGRTMFALLEGEAGVGKSRLAEELFLHVSREGYAAARTRCYSAHGYLAYASVADLLRADRLKTAVLDLPGSQMTEVSRILPELLLERSDITPPQPLAENWQRRLFFEALTATLRAAARPLLVLIDDLQWCDRETLEWLHHCFCSDPPGQVLVLGTARREEVGRDHALTRLMRDLFQTGQAVELAIRPLDADGTRLLATKIARRELEESYLSGLYAHTKGNALFIVESVRARLEDRECRPGPATPVVRAVITARLANLTAPAYALAGLAAVLGRPFTFDLLSATSDLDESTLAGALEELWLRRIIQGHGALEYGFTHDVLREVTYGELSPVRRRLLHTRVARALEARLREHPESAIGQIAAHYEQAGLPEQAIPYLQRAAQAAQRVYAGAEEADLLQRALKLCRTLPESRNRDRTELELLATLEHAQFTALGYAAPEVGETNARAFLLVKELGDKLYLLNVLGGGWLFHIVRGRLGAARDRSTEFLRAAAEEGESVRAAGHFMCGAVLFHSAELVPAREHLERALEIHPDGCEPPLPMFFGPKVDVFAWSYLSHILWCSGFPDQALRASEKAVKLAREPAHPFSLAIACSYAAMLNLFLGQPEDSERCAAEAVAVCRTHGFPYYLGCASILHAAARAKSACDQKDLNSLRSALDLFKASGAELRLPLYHGLVAEACLKHGLIAEGLAHATAASGYQTQNGETWWQPELLCLQGDLLAAEGRDADVALVCYRSALESAQRVGAKTSELRSAGRVARLLTDRGKASEARALLEPIHAGWSEGFQLPDYREASAVLERTQLRARAGSL
jgi:DNA-binding SARP family transcriptional activator